MKVLCAFSALIFLLNSCNMVELSAKNTRKSMTRHHVLSSNIQEDSLNIHFWKGGAGPTIVFVHGFGGDALITWRKELLHFAKTNTVVAYDLIWFGKSTSTEIPNLNSQTKALKKLLSYLKIESATIIGQSYGGFVVLDFAQHYPSMVEKMIIANSPGTTFNLSTLDTVCKKFELENISDLFVLEQTTNIKRLLDAATFSNPRLPKFLQKQIFDAYFNKNKTQQKELMKSLPAEKLKLQDLSFYQKIPTLVLWGKNDEIFPLSEGQKFATAINAQFVSIPNCGHAPQFDAPKMFLKLLDEFITKKPNSTIN